MFTEDASIVFNIDGGGREERTLSSALQSIGFKVQSISGAIKKIEGIVEKINIQLEVFQIYKRKFYTNYLK